tara:strand:+ start:50 stop:700 length:651 start_codon:yes stop_codon:yes gene_type:complete
MDDMPHGSTALLKDRNGVGFRLERSSEYETRLALIEALKVEAVKKSRCDCTQYINDMLLNKTQYQHKLDARDKEIAEIMDRKRRMKDLYAKTLKQNMEFTKELKALRDSINTLCDRNSVIGSKHKELRDFQILENYKNICISIFTGRERGHLYDFLNLRNIDDILKPLGVSKNQFKTAYVKLRGLRIGVAHPQDCNNSLKSVKGVLDRIACLDNEH